MTRTVQSDDIEQRVRHTLHTVAATVTETELSAAARSTATRRPRRRWRIGLGIGAVAIPLTMAAAAFVHQGPEYVDTIPKSDIIATGSVDGSRYLLIEASRTDQCGQPVTGVELVEEKENLIGSEWNTIGVQYGEPTACSPGVATDRYLKDPALYDDSGTTVGDSFVWLWAVHPDVTAVRITADDYTKDLPVYRVDGAGYALFEIPENLHEYTAELLVNGQVVPGSVEEHDSPHPAMTRTAAEPTTLSSCVAKQVTRPIDQESRCAAHRARLA